VIRASPVGLVPGSGRSAAWLLCIAAIAAGCTNDGCGSVPEPSLDVGESDPITLSYIDGSWMPIVFDDIGWTEPDVDPPLGTGELEGTLTLVDTWAEDLVGRIEIAVPGQPTLVLRGSPNTCE
jgi:hypothetical protein